MHTPASSDETVLIGRRVAMSYIAARRVVARYLQRLADQPAGARQEARKNTQPINKPKGIERSIQKENGESKTKGEDIMKSDKRDIQPKDVFPSLPKNTAVRNFAETGKDLSKALDRQVPKDKGYETVYNLSQYLIRTDGGGEGGPKGKK
jgi:hypothetical protein